MNKDKYLKYKRKYLKLKEFILSGGNTAPGFNSLEQMSPESRTAEKKDSLKIANKRSDNAVKKLESPTHHQNNSHGPHVSTAISTNPKDIAQFEQQKKIREREEKDNEAEQKKWNESFLGKTVGVFRSAVGAVVRALTPTRR
jgi:hypothetical protein